MGRGIPNTRSNVEFRLRKALPLYLTTLNASERSSTPPSGATYRIRTSPIVWHNPLCCVYQRNAFQTSLHIHSDNRSARIRSFPRERTLRATFLPNRSLCPCSDRRFLNFALRSAILCRWQSILSRWAVDKSDIAVPLYKTKSCVGNAQIEATHHRIMSGKQLEQTWCPHDSNCTGKRK